MPADMSFYRTCRFKFPSEKCGEFLLHELLSSNSGLGTPQGRCGSSAHKHILSMHSSQL